ncbi:ATP-binding cassette domain-containing protein, partial [Escherichia coli]|uniref:ATP-binding cassette domain-containing protein n=1 Tax=Escherichia coli TaxID=562 RepID=UPI0038626BFB
MISLHNICKKFNEHHVLQNINLTVEVGSIVGLAGPSGSGKSTLLRCIQKLETIDSGSIEGAD